MMKWVAHGTVTATKYLGEVEAATKEEALEKAGQLDSCYVSVCHQCSDQIEDPEITDIVVEKSWINEEAG